MMRRFGYLSALCLGVALGGALPGPWIYFHSRPHQVPWVSVAAFVIGLLGFLWTTR